ncbi:interferon-gamma-inducible GTPase 10-like [Dasypus novemcinctus]|uniref:interferon-gamma-inducible GTPase 10-like n=1 Tax=Dasypus novemcinctus TaxID=9361 RepID=UPI0003291088|nr:interferon-gamma-inducible GTPase 10-like [Dasypus novemcinctus]XP_058139808.1 interferon-gamma-inducible GTPase 10-like [Dasypus novemcinctus]
MDPFISAFLSGKNFQQMASDLIPYYATLISKAGSILSQETLTDIQVALKKGKLKDMVDMIQKSLEEAKDATLDLAVIGESGTGKSSFINALRGLSYEDEGYARVGVVETTEKKTLYQHPKYPNVNFWDLPGTGTPNFILKSYLANLEFEKYDFFIIISSTRFMLNDVLLAQEIKKIGKNFYFVRTKVDLELYNEEKSKPKTFQKEKVLQQIRNDCLKNLTNIGVRKPRIFLVSNFHLHDFDFPSLQETLLKELPAHKRHTFALLLPSLSYAAIDLKREILKEVIWLEALKSACLAFMPFMPIICGFDLPEQEKCLNRYRSYFGLDDKSLNVIAQKLGISMQKIKNSTESLDFWLLVKDDSIEAKVMNCFECYCSVNGGLSSSVMQFLKTYFLHLKFLDTVVNDAKILLHMSLKFFRPT